MMPKAIAVDFDGCLANTHELVLELMNFKHGTAYTSEDWTSWNFWADHVKDGDADFWKVFDIMDRTHLRRAIRPTSPFAVPTIKHLQQRGFRVEVVTSNAPAVVEDMKGWLFGHGLNCEVHAIGRMSAHQKAELPYDIFFDDAPSLAEAMKDEPTKTLFLVDQPWNRAVATADVPNIVRFNDWRLISQFIDSIGVDK
jgi:5'(3')-deoxyribonucleotidase